MGPCLSQLMMTGRDRCNLLKGVRKSLADKIGVDLHQTECSYEGECRGTCPKCRQEERILNEALARKGTALAGAALVTTSLAACTPSIFPWGDGLLPESLAGGEPSEVVLAGDVQRVDAPEGEDDPDESENGDLGSDALGDADSAPDLDGLELQGDVSPSFLDSGDMGGESEALDGASLSQFENIFADEDGER